MLRVGGEEEDQHNSEINLSEFNTCEVHCTGIYLKKKG